MNYQPIWYEEGKAAFAKGEPRVPPPPPEDNPVGGPWADNARAWLLGWDRGNLDAVLEHATPE